MAAMSNAERQARWRAKRNELADRTQELEAEVAELRARLAEGGEPLRAERGGKGVMTQAQHRLILSCLHPDRVTDPAQKERCTEAFRVFKACFPDRSEQRDIPREQMVPHTAEEWAKRREAVKARRKRWRGPGLRM